MQNGLPDSPRSGRSSQGGAPGDSCVKSGLANVLDPLSSGADAGERGAAVGNALPTLHEDAEFSCPTDSVKPLPLTLSALHLTEKKRAQMNFEVRPLPGHYAGYENTSNFYVSYFNLIYYQISKSPSRFYSL